MTATCEQCKTVNNGDPLHCWSCGAQLRRPKLNSAGRVLMFLLLTGWVITPIACLRLVYMFITDPSYDLLSLSWQIPAWLAGFWVYLRFMEMFEGFARMR